MRINYVIIIELESICKSSTLDSNILCPIVNTNAHCIHTHTHTHICLIVAGPSFWGLINPQWNMCNKGRRQSPIDVVPDKLLFDPYLRTLHIDKHKVRPTN